MTDVTMSMDATSTAPGEPSNQFRGQGGFWQPNCPFLNWSTPQTPPATKVATPESRSILTATNQQRKEALEWLGYTTLYEDKSMSKLVDARFDLLPCDTANPPPSINTQEKDVVPMQEWKPVCSFINKRFSPGQANIPSMCGARQSVEPMYNGLRNNENLQQTTPLFYRRHGKTEKESEKINISEKKILPRGKSENESGKINPVPVEKKVIPMVKSENTSLTITPQKEVSRTERKELARSSRRRKRYSSGKAKLPIRTPKNHLRHFVKHDYHDHSQDKDPNPEKSETRVVQRARGMHAGSTAGFVCKLYHMLEEIRRGKEYEEVVSWRPHGRAFSILDSKRFLNEVMPKYFQQSKFSSFLRQLNLYGFHRITQGPDRGAYYHELFLRGKPFLCLDIQRIKIKGTVTKAASSPESEPNFYDMPELPTVNASSSPCFSV